MTQPTQQPSHAIPELTDAQLNALTSDAAHFLHDWIRASVRSQWEQEQAQERSLSLLGSLVQTFAPKLSQAQAAKAVTVTEKALRRHR